MSLAFLAVLLPTLFWNRPADTAGTLRQAGIQRLYVPAGTEQAWRKLGFAATTFDPARAVRATAPGVEYHMNVASATRVPWVNANGWRFEREPSKAYSYDAPAGSAALSAAEAFAYGVDAAIRASPDDLEDFARMLRFCAGLGQSRLPVMANIGIIDDGSEALGEVLNLLARHNLLFHMVPSVDPKYDLNIRLGAAGYSMEDAANPYEFAMKVRRRLTDEKRLLRIYGSHVVLARLTGDGQHVRVHLLNYGRAAVTGLRVRVLGSYPQGKLSAYGNPHAVLEDYAVQEGATEFTIPEMGAYAVVDLGVTPR